MRFPSSPSSSCATFGGYPANPFPLALPLRPRRASSGHVQDAVAVLPQAAADGLLPEAARPAAGLRDEPVPSRAAGQAVPDTGRRADPCTGTGRDDAR